MPREHESYRDNFEQLSAYFGKKRHLTISDVAAYCGRDRRTVAKAYNISKEGITIPTLARRMCK